MLNNNLLKLNLKNYVDENERNHRFQINPTEILVNNLIPQDCKTYDLIISVNAPEGKANDIFKKYVKEWEYINPNLKIMDARIYMNTFSNQRLVIDFIPIEKMLDKNNEYKEEQTRTMLKALKHQGCTSKTLWFSNQKNILEDICKECNFEISHHELNHKPIDELLR